MEMAELSTFHGLKPGMYVVLVLQILLVAYPIFGILKETAKEP